MAEEPVAPAAAAALDQADIDALLAKGGTDGLTEFERRQCRHCGGVHSRACPRVRRLRYTDSGAIAEIEYWASSEWSDAGVIWPEMLGVLYEPKGATQ